MYSYIATVVCSALNDYITALSCVSIASTVVLCMFRGKCERKNGFPRLKCTSIVETLLGQQASQLESSCGEIDSLAPELLIFHKVLPPDTLFGELSRNWSGLSGNSL